MGHQLDNYVSDFPQTWDVQRIKYLLLDGKDGIRIGPFGTSLKLEQMVDDGYKVYGQENVINKNFDVGKRFLNDDKFEELKQYEVFTDDILITMMGTTGRVIIVPENTKKGIMDSHLIRVRFNKSKVDNRFFVYQIMESIISQHQIKVRSKGSIMEGLNSSIIKSLYLPLPSLETQKQIATFLDKETTRIDTLISKKHKQMELLQEKRQAIITQSVTKGLNENVKMKDSGVEWIGEIPAHWEVKRLRHVGNAIIGLTYSPNDVTDETEGTLVLRASNIHNGKITLEDNVFVNTIIPEKLKTRKGDILICSRNGSEKLVGKSGMINSNEEGLSFGAFTTIFRSDVNDYLFYFFNSGMMREQSGLFNTSTVFQLTTGILNNIRVAIPPDKKERNELIQCLKEETGKNKILISKIEKSIKLLKEYRSSLITHAVSGQIDISKPACALQADRYEVTK